jgi:hypothetical protein
MAAGLGGRVLPRGCDEAALSVLISASGNCTMSATLPTLSSHPAVLNPHSNAHTLSARYFKYPTPSRLNLALPETNTTFVSTLEDQCQGNNPKYLRLCQGRSSLAAVGPLHYQNGLRPEDCDRHQMFRHSAPLEKQPLLKWKEGVWEQW